MFVKLVYRFTSVLVSNPQLPCYIYSPGLIRFVTSCYIFRREKFCQTSFQVHFCVSFQHTTTLLRMFIGLVTSSFQLLHLQKRNGLSNQFPGSRLYQFPIPEYISTYIRCACYVLLPVVTSLEEKSLVKLVSRFTSVLASNPQLPCYKCSFGLLYVASGCYIFIREKVCQTSFHVNFCIHFQPPNTLLHMFIGLVTCWFQFLHLQNRNGFSNQFPGSILYQFPTPEYIITYIRCACYVLLPVVTSLEENSFVKLVSRFTSVLVSNRRLPGYICPLGLLRVVSSCYTFRRENVCQTSFQVIFVLISNPQLPCYVYSLCLLRFVTSCYIFRREKVCQTSFHVYFCISFQPTTTLLPMFIGLVTCSFQFFTSLEQKWFVKLVSCLNFVLVSKHRIHYYIYSLCLLRFNTSCYIFRREKFCQTSFQIYFCISLQPTTTLLHMFIGLDTCCFQLLHLQKGNLLSNYFPGPFCINFQPQTTLLHIFAGLVTFFYKLLHLWNRKGLSKQFPGSLLCQFPTHDYLVTNVHSACYVLFPVVTSL